MAIGTDPALTYAATAPLPAGVDELLFAGFLRGEAVDLVQCKTVDLQVPAHAEFVLEGYVDVDETRMEGPFGDHTGYYSLADQYPVLPSHRSHPSAGARVRRPPSWARPPWRTPTWARPPSASSCRS